MTKPTTTAINTVEHDFFAVNTHSTTTPRLHEANLATTGKRPATWQMENQLLTPRTTAAVESVTGGQIQLGPVKASSSSSTAATTSATTSSSAGATLPFTIFYNGTVSVFHVPLDKAQAILRMAETAHAKEDPMRALLPTPPPPPRPPHVVFLEDQQMGLLNGDLPLARKLSLRRFLERRRGREKM